MFFVRHMEFGAKPRRFIIGCTGPLDRRQGHPQHQKTGSSLHTALSRSGSLMYNLSHDGDIRAAALSQALRHELAH